MKTYFWIKTPFAGVAVALLLLASAGCDNQSKAHMLGTNPIQEGSFWDCPSGYAIRAYSPSRFYYPTNYPGGGPGPEVHIARCFADEQQAVSGGYQLAPSPPKGTLINGIYLMPLDSTIMETCRMSAAHLGFPVPCPGLVPADDIDSPCPVLDGVACGAGSTFFYEALFSAPPTYVGFGMAGSGDDYHSVGHLDIRAIRINQDPRGTLAVVSCIDPGAAQPAGLLMGAQAYWVACPAGSAGIDAGHVVLAWAVGGVAYDVSLHGITKVNRSLDKAIADSIVLARP